MQSLRRWQVSGKVGLRARGHLCQLEAVSVSGGWPKVRQREKLRLIPNEGGVQ
jgi:hypothetical protein